MSSANKSLYLEKSPPNSVSEQVCHPFSHVPLPQKFLLLKHTSNHHLSSCFPPFQLDIMRFSFVLALAAGPLMAYASNVLEASTKTFDSVLGKTPSLVEL